MKKLIIWTLIITLMLSMVALTACNQQEEQPTTPVETTGTQPTTVPTEPTAAPTDAPTEAPTEASTDAPTEAPTAAPTQAPTAASTQAPTQAPTAAPTQAPTSAPTQAPTAAPTAEPTQPTTRKPGWGTITVPTQAPTQPVDTITITGPTSEVFGCVDNAKNYLLSGGDRVDRYKNASGVKSAAKPVDITWNANFAADSFTVRYGTNANLSNAKEITVNGNMTSVSVYNLLRGTTYYVEISAESAAGKTVVAKSSFTTSSLAPRVMNIDTLYNVRDLGGYKTSDGKVIKQNMIFRGDALLPCAQSNANLSDAGKKFMSEELGIKLEIDFRTAAEAQYDGTTSVIPGARLEYMNLGAYNACFSNHTGYAEVFKALADKNNYPIYMHCTGGADRTGTVSYLLLALLGVKEEDLIIDYEFTTFSAYGARCTSSGSYSSQFWGIEAGLSGYKGNNLAEWTESYLLAIGVTQAEIDSIKTILKG